MLIRSLMARLEPFAAEAVLTGCMAWCAKCLLDRGAGLMTGPFGPYFRVMLAILPSSAWTALAFASAGLLASGLVLAHVRACSVLGMAARIGGLALAGFFLATLGLSWMAAFPDSLGAGPMLLLGLTSWGVLLRGPALARPSS